MPEFPIDEIYRRVARFDAIDDKKGTTIGTGSGFFYWYNDEIYLATSRNYIIMEEKAFLPDSIIVYVDTEPADKTRITLPLYDKTEKPIWRVLTSEQEQAFISIPIPRTGGLDFTHWFLALKRLPSTVYLPVDDISLNLHIPTGVSLADYFFYSQPENEKALQKRIEWHDDFRINRRGFARDMIEMVLVLVQHNLDKIEAAGKKGRKEELDIHLLIHDNLISELENIMIKFGDVLEPSVLDKIRNIFAILKERNLEDHLVARHLIRKVLLLLGENILFTQ